MNTSSMLRRSKSHRHAEKRNAVRLEDAYSWRNEIVCPREVGREVMANLKQSGFVIEQAIEEVYGQCYRLFVIPRRLDPKAKHNGFRVVGQEKVRK